MLSLGDLTTTEQIIEKSRFLTYSMHVEGEEEAREMIAMIRDEHPFATHVCYAYVADKIGNLQRFSDDGEPSGTAGMPILDVIKKNKLFETCICVVRYFGGIKLGAGGLVRAYSGGAAGNVAEAKKYDYLLCKMLTVKVGYSMIDGMKLYLSARECEVKDTEYLDSVLFHIAVKESYADELKRGIVDYCGGKVEIFENETYFYPFPLAN